jgi:hypothetical protein
MRRGDSEPNGRSLPASLSRRDTATQTARQASKRRHWSPGPDRCHPGPAGQPRRAGLASPGRAVKWPGAWGPVVSPSHAPPSRATVACMHAPPSRATGHRRTRLPHGPLRGLRPLHCHRRLLPPRDSARLWARPAGPGPPDPAAATRAGPAGRRRQRQPAAAAGTAAGRTRPRRRGPGPPAAAGDGGGDTAAVARGCPTARSEACARCAATAASCRRVTRPGFGTGPPDPAGRNRRQPEPPPA